MSSSRGSKPDRRKSVATLSTSASMLSRTPGYCTLIANSRPSCVTARCTCPIEAAAIGLGSNWRNRVRQTAPHSRASTRCSCGGGICWALSRRRAMISASSGGKKSPASMDIIWPSFMAAPRRCASRSATFPTLAGVSNMSRRRGRSPSASRRAPSPMIPPARPPASRPNCPSRCSLPLGTDRPEPLPLSSLMRSPSLAAWNALERPGDMTGDPATIEIAWLWRDCFAIDGTAVEWPRIKGDMIA